MISKLWTFLVVGESTKNGTPVALGRCDERGYQVEEVRRSVEASTRQCLHHTCPDACEIGAWWTWEWLQTQEDEEDDV